MPCQSYKKEQACQTNISAPTNRKNSYWKKKRYSKNFWKKTDFAAEHLSQSFDTKSWY